MDAYLERHWINVERHESMDDEPITIEQRWNMYWGWVRDLERPDIDLDDYSRAFGTSRQWAQEMAGEAVL